MSLWCIQGGRRRLASAVLAVALGLMLFGCGKTAEITWEPTKDDTAGIKAAVEANKAYFRTGLAELAMQMCDTVLPGTTRTVLAGEVLGNPYKSRFRLDSLQHVLYSDSYDLEYTFIAQLDTLETETTCTVTMAETIPGMLRMHAWEKTDSVGVDTIEVGEGEYIYLTRYSTTMAPSNTFVEKKFTGVSTDGCVLKKVNGTWELWKMGGGGRFYSPGLDDAPYILRFFLNSADNRVDTVNLRPDTLQYGVQRFYSVDTAHHELLTYQVGDWVKASNLTTNVTDAFDYLHFNGRRYEFGDTVRFAASDTGIRRLSLEHIPATVLWEVGGDYNATAWGIPIRIQQ